MPQPAETFDAYDAVGNREDLSDIIHNISPTLTPFQNNIGRGKATNIKHEWQVDSLDDVDEDNAHIDGDDATGDAITPTDRVDNYCQIMRKVVIVSGRQNSSNSAGRRNELAYQVAKKGKELKRDKEAILLRNQAKVIGTNVLAARMAGLEAIVSSNTNRGAGGADGTAYGTTAATDGAQRAFTEALLKDVVQQGYDAGAEFDMLMLGSFNKQVASTFGGIATQFKDVKNNNMATIVGASDIYVTDFGELRIVPNRFQRGRTAFLIDTSMAQVSTFRPMMTKPLAKTGDSEKRLLLADETLQVHNEEGMGIIADLTTA